VPHPHTYANSGGTVCALRARITRAACSLRVSGDSGSSAGTCEAALIDFVSTPGDDALETVHTRGSEETDAALLNVLTVAPSGRQCVDVGAPHCRAFVSREFDLHRSKWKQETQDWKAQLHLLAVVRGVSCRLVADFEGSRRHTHRRDTHYIFWCTPAPVAYTAGPVFRHDAGSMGPSDGCLSGRGFFPRSMEPCGCGACRTSTPSTENDLAQ